ncbi:acetyltransferase [Calothrix sp. NIES-2100]|uniref:GNAT family N-acetyltransferase n=1 Tax=Calothrix sp. NIES-2100 TaxID=1954172 RepID=UPI000B5ECC09|nr:acetyltransferase [Calothrix sp. NIES-2100]
MKHQFLVGERIYLRALEQYDLQGEYLQWLNDQDITKWMQQGIFPSTYNSLENYFESIQNSKTDIVLAIILKEQERHIGNIGLHAIHAIFRSAEIGILLGAKDIWGQGIATEAINLLVSHAFLRLNLNRLYAGSVEKNLGCIRAFEKAGFIQEGISRQSYYCEGQYLDCVNLSLLRLEYLTKISARGD